MSDTSWREAARALRNRSISAETFVEALGLDLEVIEALSNAANKQAFELKNQFCSCGHEYYAHVCFPDRSQEKTCQAVDWVSDGTRTKSVPCKCKAFDAKGGPNGRPRPAKIGFW